jgi:hypothetical protein
VWAKQVASSDSKADNAQGMATAMEVTVKQLEAALAQRQQQLAAQQGDADKLRLLLERSRLAAVGEAAAARAQVAALSKEVGGKRGRAVLLMPASEAAPTPLTAAPPCCVCSAQAKEGQALLAERTAALAAASAALKTRTMELEGASAQLQVLTKQGVDGGCSSARVHAVRA